MSDTQTVVTAVDTWVDQARPNDSHGGDSLLHLRAGANARYGFVFFPYPFPLGARVVVATLHVFLGAAWSGSTTITQRRVTENWSEKRTNWSNRPAVASSTDPTTTVSSGVKGQEVLIDVTDLMADVSANAAYTGIRLEVGATTDRPLFSAEAADDSKRPYLVVEWATSPTAPTDLAPAGGRVTSTSKPRLLWTFGDPSDPGSVQSAAQVIIYSDAAMTTAVYDTTKMPLAESALDLATTAFTGIPAGASRWWKVRVWDDDDEVSDYSDGAEMSFSALGTVTITNPPNGGVVQETTPPVLWTFSLTENAYSVLVEEQQADGSWAIVAERSRVNATDLSWTIPVGALQPGPTYRVSVRVWDAYERDPPGYAEDVNTFTYAAAGGPTAPSAFTAVADGPAVALAWSRTTAPDYFRLLVDGEIVADFINPVDVLTSGTNYAMTWWRATPRVEHTYELAALVADGSSVYQQSTGNITVDLATDPTGITLADEDTDESVYLAGQEAWDAEIEEVSTVYTPTRRRSPVLVTDMVRGYEGGVSGVLVQVDERTPATLRDTLLTLRSGQRNLRLILGDRNIPVVVYGVTAVPTPYPGDEYYEAQFSFFQTGEFDVAWEA